MMNGTLLPNGFDVMSMRASRSFEFNQEMVKFYIGRDAT